MKYPEEVKSFIAQHVQGTTTKDLVSLVNAEFGLNFTESKMQNFKKNHKLRSGTPQGFPAGFPSKQYPDEVRKFILDNYKGTGYKEMAKLLNSKFGTNYTPSNIKGYYANHKLNTGLKGHFKKGQMPHNYRPVGSERINVDGYTEIKIADPKKWKAKHGIVWEAKNGPVPKNHVIIFADGNKSNFDLDNLLMLSRQQLVRMNQNHLIQPNSELTKTGVIIADIGIKIGERKKRKRSNAPC